jgi:hypothetical protein
MSINPRSRSFQEKGNRWKNGRITIRNEAEFLKVLKAGKEPFTKETLVCLLKVVWLHTEASERER